MEAIEGIKDKLSWPPKLPSPNIPPELAAIWDQLSQKAKQEVTKFCDEVKKKTGEMASFLDAYDFITKMGWSQQLAENKKFWIGYYGRLKDEKYQGKLSAGIKWDDKTYAIAPEIVLPPTLPELPPMDPVKFFKDAVDAIKDKFPVPGGPGGPGGPSLPDFKDMLDKFNKALEDLKGKLLSLPTPDLPKELKDGLAKFEQALKGLMDKFPKLPTPDLPKELKGAFDQLLKALNDMKGKLPEIKLPELPKPELPKPPQLPKPPGLPKPPQPPAPPQPPKYEGPEFELSLDLPGNSLPPVKIGLGPSTELSIGNTNLLEPVNKALEPVNQAGEELKKALGKLKFW